LFLMFFFFFSSRRRHTRFSRDWSSDVCSSDLAARDDRVEHLSSPGCRELVHGPPLPARLAREPLTRPEGFEGERVVGRDDREDRSEERRVGKEGRARWGAEQAERNQTKTHAAV